MGLCTSSAALSAEERKQQEAEYLRSKDIDARNAHDLEADSKVCKLLLLGAGESGKSTLFKQILTIYGEGLNQKQLDQFLPSIQQLTIASMKQLCIQSNLLALNAPECKLQAAASERSRNFMLSLPDDVSLLDKEIASHVVTLWKDQGIKNVFEKRSQFQLVDTADYFFDRVELFSSDNYSPTYQDVLRCRVRTTGIVENRFDIAGHKFLLVDVGGQRNERKKWIHCFEGVTAVIFVTSLSEYDQCLFEDNFTSRIIESLSLFEEVLQMKWFLSCPVILFLNKRDLFEEKLKHVPLSKVFPDYTGAENYEEGVKYILEKFMSKADGRRKTMIYSHVTCAMDTDNVHHVFEDVKEILIRKALTHSGLDSI